MVHVKASLILDTSALLNSLAFVQSLAASALVFATELVLPREAIKELDCIKDREPLGSIVGSKAREAINWINRTLVSQNTEETPVLRGQRFQETENPQLGGDDAILDCACFNLVSTQRLTILLSTDHNLCNRAVIEGLETLDPNAPGVTSDKVFSAIETRTMNDMDLDEWAQPQWVPPPREYSRESSPGESLPNIDHDSFRKIEDEMGEEKSLAPAQDLTSSKDMPSPIPGEDMQTQIMSNLSSLIDWHLHRTFNDDELLAFKYRKPPETSAQMARVLKQFSMLFSEVVTRKTIEAFSASVRKRTIDKEYIMLHVKLLQALSLYSADYQKMIAKFINH